MLFKVEKSGQFCECGKILSKIGGNKFFGWRITIKFVKIKMLIMRNILLVILVILICGVSCNNKKETHSRDLEIADSLMFIEPDSSLRILENLDIRNFDTKDQAYYSLLLTQAKARNYIEPKNDSLINVALSYYSKGNDLRKEAWSYLYASDVYESLGRKNEALNFIQKSSETANGIDDCRLHFYIHYFWGRLLYGEPPYDESEKQFIEAKRYAQEVGDTALVISVLVDLGRLYYVKNDLPSALATLNEGIRLAKTAGFRDSNVYALYGYIAIFLENDNQNIEALRFVDECLSCDLSNDAQRKSFMLKARILVKLDQLDSAEVYLKKGLSNESLASKANFYDIMSCLEERRGNYKAALNYKRVCDDFMDSIRDEERQHQVMEWQKKYDTTALETERNKLLIERQRIKVYVLMFVVVVLVAVIFVVIWRSKINSKISKMVVAQNDREELMRNKLLEYNPVIVKLRKFGELDDASKIKAVKSYRLTEKELGQFVEAMDVCYNGFVDRLMAKYENLSKDDIYLCCLLRLGMRSGSIALLLDISMETLRKRKQRLKNDKMAAEAGKFDTLDEYLRGF